MKSAEHLLRVRAMYVIQLLVTLASETAVNLATLFDRFKEKALLEKLAFMDACLLSYEAMTLAWSAALKDLMLAGSLDIKSVLSQCNISTVTGMAAAAGLKVSGTADDKPDDESEPAMVFSWKELMTFGFSQSSQLSFEQLHLLELRVQAFLAETCLVSNAPWGERLTVHVQQDASVRGKAHPEVLLRVNEETDSSNILRWAASHQRMFKMPKDFKLYFTGMVGDFAF